MDNDLGANLDTANSDQLLSLSFELWPQVLDNEVLNGMCTCTLLFHQKLNFPLIPAIDNAIDFFYTNIIDDILNSSTACACALSILCCQTLSFHV
jgi:hypothetical protein